jgi:O-antigen/teichoic acid export membrane protein
VESKQSVLGLLDQGVAALTGAIPIVALGRLAGAHDVGLLSLAVSAALFVSIATQSFFLSGYPVFLAQDRASERLRTFQVVLFGAVVPAVLAPVCFCLLLFIGGPGAGGMLAALLMVSFLTTTVTRAYLRTLSLVRRDFVAILALDTMAAVVLMAWLANLAARGTVGATSVFVALSVTNALFIVAWCLKYADKLQVSLAGLASYLARSARFGGWAFAAVICGSMPYYLMPWILFAVHGTEATGAFAAGATIAGFVNHAMLGLLRGVEARTADAYRNGAGSLREAMIRTGWIVLPPVALIIVGLFLAADAAGAFLLPGRGAEVGAVAQLLSLALAVGSVRVIIGNGLWAMNNPRAALPADMLRGFASVALGVVGAYQAGPIGCAVAILIGDIGSTVLVAIRYRAEEAAVIGDG